jgi:hypothetical protein
MGTCGRPDPVICRRRLPLHLSDAGDAFSCTGSRANGNHVIGTGNDGEPWFSGSRFGMREAQDIGGATRVISTQDKPPAFVDAALDRPRPAIVRRIRQVTSSFARLSA